MTAVLAPGLAAGLLARRGRPVPPAALALAVALAAVVAAGPLAAVGMAAAVAIVTLSAVAGLRRYIVPAPARRFA